MSSRTPTDEEIETAIALHLPHGWRVKWRNGRKFPGEKFKDKTYGYIRGITNFINRRIDSIYPINFYNLAVFLHECGHLTRV